MMLLGAWERMSAERAHQMGLVSEVVPQSELLERAMWVARAIASAPVMAIQGTLRAIWMTHEVSRREALSQVSTFVALERSSTTSREVRRSRGQRDPPEWRLR